MMVGAPTILNASILIVDDQESNVSLLERLLGEAGYHPRGLNDESTGGLRAASEKRLRPDSARPTDAQHGWFPSNGGPQDKRI
jgi:CheY-like chemotaxis protein